MAFSDIDAIDFFNSDTKPTQSQKALRRQRRKLDRNEKQAARHPKPLQPRTRTQADYVDSLIHNELTFGIGPAGVGKTYVPARLYGEMLDSGELAKLYLARPNVAKAKHRNGFLPGNEKDKTAPWLVPIMDGLKDSMSRSTYDRMLREGVIEIVPFEFIQGRTFKDAKGAAAIIDEAENLDFDDLYITLTRQGDGLSMVLCGDIYQARIPDSGLARVVEMSFEYNLESVGVIEFDEADVVRSRQAAQWVRAFRQVAQKATGTVTEIHFPAFLKGTA